MFLVNESKKTVTRTFTIASPDPDEPIIIWDLIFLEQTLFSADSRGYVCSWDLKTGVIMKNFFLSPLDLLCLQKSLDETTLYAAGVDKAVYTLVSSNQSEDPWIPGPLIRGCTHDVKSMVLLPPLSALIFEGQSNSAYSSSSRLLCVGSSCRIEIVPATTLKAFTNQLAKIKPFKQSPYDVGLIDSNDQFTNTLCLMPYKLPSARSTPFFACALYESVQIGLFFSAPKLEIFRLASNPKDEDQPFGLLKLAQVTPKSPQIFISCAISPCGKYLAYSSDADLTRILTLSVKNIKNDDLQKEDVCIKRVDWSHLTDKFYSNQPSRQQRKRKVSNSSAVSSEEDDTLTEVSPKTKKMKKLLRQRSNSNASSSYGSSADEQDLSRSEYSENDIQDKAQLDPMELFINPESAAANSEKRFLLPLTVSGAILSSCTCLRFSWDSKKLFMVLQKEPSNLYCFHIAKADFDYKVEFPEAEKINKLMCEKTKYQRGDFGLLFLLCASGRVLVLDASSGKILHTIPRALSLFSGNSEALHDSVWFSNIPISVAVNHEKADEKLRMTILLASGQIREWSLMLSFDSKQKVTVEECLQADWLTEFWSHFGQKVETKYWGINSISYIDENTWLLSSHKFFLRVKRGAPMKSSLRVGSEEGCLSIISQKGNVVETIRMPNGGIAAITLDPCRVIASLKPAFWRKIYGL
ncbi:U3 small nucleolar RNA-associated protein 4 [Cichlidogyrus casuarinus]|uniref:U3 small nucleolar RNA-associated protein 4 n=1 Tax=Cichlidogyrus casuarinus TaxID=1844966 RepID=A0ABD2QNP5_9PLAT